MRIIEQCRVADAFGERGIHEGRGRLQLPGKIFEGDDRLINGVEVTLTRRSPLVWRILAGWPMGCLRVEILPEDVPALRIIDSRSADDWTTAILEDQADSGTHVRALAAAPNPVSGPLICTAQTRDGGPSSMRAPIVVFDGLHRVAAWIEQLRRGAAYAITGMLVVTEHPVPLQVPE